MKVALQRAISLLREHPRLWMPIIVATGVSFVLSLLLKVLTHKLTLALINGYSVSQSVLGNTPVRNYWHLTTLQILPFILPISFLGQFLVICFFTFALVVTAWKALGISILLFPVSGNLLRQLLWFSTKVFIAYHLLALLVVIPMRFLPLRSLHSYVLPLGICDQIILTLIVGAMAIRFLARVLERKATPAAVMSARWLAILTVSVSVAIAFLASRIQHPLFVSWPQMTQPAVQTVLLGGDVISYLPYAPFFIALVFLLEDELPLDASSPDSEPCPERSPTTT